MEEHYSASVRAEGLRRELQPSKLDKTLIAVLREIVRSNIIGDPQTINGLTERFLREAYAETAKTDADAGFYENKEAFMGAVTRGFIARVEEYNVNLKLKQTFPDQKGR